MKNFLFYQILFSAGLACIVSFAWATASTYPTASTSLGPLAKTIKSETTQIPTTGPNSVNVQSSGNATCGAGQVMIGFVVTDSNNAYVSYDATQNVKTDCSGFHFKYNNYTARIMQDPTKLTFTIYCKPINLAFF